MHRPDFRGSRIDPPPPTPLPEYRGEGEVRISKLVGPRLSRGETQHASNDFRGSAIGPPPRPLLPGVPGRRGDKNFKARWVATLQRRQYLA